MRLWWRNRAKVRSGGRVVGKELGKPRCRGTWREHWPYLQKPPGAHLGDDTLSTNGKQQAGSWLIVIGTGRA